MDVTDIPSKDEFEVAKASKDELMQFALAHFGKELDGKDKVGELRNQVQALLDADKQPTASARVEDTTPDNGDYQYCLNPKNGRILIAADGMRRLVKQGVLVPCDKEGNRL